VTTDNIAKKSYRLHKTFVTRKRNQMKLNLTINA